MQPPPRRRLGIQGVIGVVIGGLLLLSHHPRLGTVALTLSSTSLLLALFGPPAWIRAVHHGLELFAKAVGQATTFVVLSLVYFLFFLPVGLLSRGKATARFQRLLDPKAATYWRKRTTGMSQSERQF